MSDTPSQSEANKMLRVLLQGTVLRTYTVTVHLPDGNKIEFQSDSVPDISYDPDLRSEWLKNRSRKENYDTYPVMEWKPGMILLVEENPNA